MKKSYPSVRMFENPFLEKFSHVHPITPLVIWSPVVAYLIWRSVVLHRFSLVTILSLGLLGLLTWTLAEYLLHRFVFHFHAEGPVEERMQFIIHGVHHADPVDPTRLVMPPVASIIFSVIFYTGFRSVFGASHVDPFFAFFIVGYLSYDYIHFSVHHFTPRTRVGKFLKHSHMLHHYVTHGARWGVSSPIWDYVFGTLDGNSKGLRTQRAPDGS